MAHITRRLRLVLSHAHWTANVVQGGIDDLNHRAYQCFQGLVDEQVDPEAGRITADDFQGLVDEQVDPEAGRITADDETLQSNAVTDSEDKIDLKNLKAVEEDKFSEAWKVFLQQLIQQYLASNRYGDVEPLSLCSIAKQVNASFLKEVFEVARSEIVEAFGLSSREEKKREKYASSLETLLLEVFERSVKALSTEVRIAPGINFCFRWSMHEIEKERAAIHQRQTDAAMPYPMRDDLKTYFQYVQCGLEKWLDVAEETVTDLLAQLEQTVSQDAGIGAAALHSEVYVCPSDFVTQILELQNQFTQTYTQLRQTFRNFRVVFGNDSAAPVASDIVAALHELGSFAQAQKGCLIGTVEKKLASYSQALVEQGAQTTQQILGEAGRKAQGVLRDTLKSATVTSDQASILLNALSNYLGKNTWRIRERAVLNLQIILSLKQSFNPAFVQTVEAQLTQSKINESHARVRSLLDNPSFADEMVRVLRQHWEGQQSQVKQRIGRTLQQIAELQNKARIEPDKDVRGLLLQACEDEQKTLDEHLSHLSGVEAQVGITIQFLGDMKKQLSYIDARLTDIKQDLSQMQVGIQHLVGRSIEELFRFRLQQLKDDPIFKELHVPIQGEPYALANAFKHDGPGEEATNEENLEEGKETTKRDQVDAPDKLDMRPSDLKDRVLSFLQDESKSTLLIAGQSGSGKSVFMRHLSRQLLQSWTDNGEKERLVPIWCSLASLEQPLTKLVQETLSSFYGFDERRIQELKAEVMKPENESRYKLVFILDSYDEIKQQYQYKNLYDTNDLEEWGPVMRKENGKILKPYPKVIITCRTEHTDPRPDHISWFCPIIQNALLGYEPEEHYQELRISSFAAQKTAYLNRYYERELSHLFFKSSEKDEQLQAAWKQLVELCGFVRESDNAIKLYSSIMHTFSQENHSHSKVAALALIEPIQAEYIQRFIQNNAVHRLWSPQKYHHATRELSDLLTTPFMLSVVLKVIPGLAEASVDEQRYKEYFIRLLCEKSRYDCLTEIEAEKYWSQVKPYLFDEEVKVRGLRGGDLDTVQKKYDVEHIFLLKKEDFDREIGDVLVGVKRRLTEAVKVASSLAKEGEKTGMTQHELQKKYPLANFQVEHAMSALTKIFQPKPIVRYDLYEEFVALLLSEEIQKLVGRKYGDEPMLAEDMYSDLSQYSRHLALKMVQQGLARVNYQVAGKLFRESNEWDVFFKPEGQRKADVMRAAPVKGNIGSYAFIHKSLQEYFVAEVLYSTVMAYPALTDTLLIDVLLDIGYQTKQRDEVDIVTSWEMDTPEQREAYVERISDHELVKRRGRSVDHIRNFVLELNELFERFNAFPVTIKMLETEPAICQRFLADKIRIDGRFQTALLSVVQLSKLQHNIALAAALCITVLNSAKVSFSGMDLSGVQLPGARLDYALMHSTKLRHVNFSVYQGVVYETTARSMILRQADLTAADVTRLNFYEPTVTKFTTSEKNQQPKTIYYADFDPDSSRILLIALDGVYICDEDHQIVYFHPIPILPHNHLQLTNMPDGRFVVLDDCKRDKYNGKIIGQGTLWLWSLEKNEWGPGGEQGVPNVTGYALSPDGKYLVMDDCERDDFNRIVIMRGTIWLWSLEKNEWGPGGEQGLVNVRGYEFSPDSNYLVVDDCEREKYNGNIIGQGTLWIWSLKRNDWGLDGEQRLANVRGYEFSPDSSYLVVDDCKRDKYNGNIVSKGTLCLWVLEKNEWGLGGEQGLANMGSYEFSPEGKYLVVDDYERDEKGEIMSQGTLWLWSLEKNDWGLGGEQGLANMWGYKFSRDDKCLVYNDHLCGNDDKFTGRGMLHLWSLEKNRWGPGGEHGLLNMRGCEFSPDGKYLLVDDCERNDNDRIIGQGTLWLWSLEENDWGPGGEQGLANVTGYEFSPDGKYLVLDDRERHIYNGESIGQGTLWLWSLEKNEWGPGREQGLANMWGFDFSPEGNYLVVDDRQRCMDNGKIMCDGTFRLWSLERNEWVPGVKQLLYCWSRYEFSSGDKDLLFDHRLRDEDDKIIGLGTLQLWSLEKNEWGLGGEQGLANMRGYEFSPDGKYLVVDDGHRTLRLWSSEKNHWGPGGEQGLLNLRGYEFSPDCKYLLLDDCGRNKYGEIIMRGTLWLWSLEKNDWGPGGMEGLANVWGYECSPDGVKCFLNMGLSWCELLMTDTAAYISSVLRVVVVFGLHDVRLICVDGNVYFITSRGSLVFKDPRIDIEWLSKDGRLYYNHIVCSPKGHWQQRGKLRYDADNRLRILYENNTINSYQLVHGKPIMRYSLPISGQREIVGVAARRKAAHTYRLYSYKSNAECLSWDIAKTAVLRTPNEMRNVVISRIICLDKHLVIQNTQTDVTLFDRVTQKKHCALESARNMYTLHRYLAVDDCKRNHKGRIIGQGTIRLWSLEKDEWGPGGEQGLSNAWGYDFSPDGKYLVVDDCKRDNKGEITRQGTLWLWSLEKNDWGLGGEQGLANVMGYEFSPEGDYLVVKEFKHRDAYNTIESALRLWSLEKNDWGPGGEHGLTNVGGYRFSPEGNYLLFDDCKRDILGSIVSQGTLWFWSLKKHDWGTGGEHGLTNVGGYRFSPDGNYLLVDDCKRDILGSIVSTGTLWFWSLKKHDWDPGGEHRLVNVWGYEFSLDSNYLMVDDCERNDNGKISGQRTLRLWSLKKNDWGPGGERGLANAKGCKLSPDGSYLVVDDCERRDGKISGQGTLRLWSLEKNDWGPGGEHGFPYVWGYKFSPDGKYLVMDDRVRDDTSELMRYGTLWLWSLKKNDWSLCGKQGLRKVRGYDFSPDGSYLVIDDCTRSIHNGKIIRQGTLRLWSLEKNGWGLGGEQGLANMWGYEFSPDGKYLLLDDCKRDKYYCSIIGQGTLWLWSLEENEWGPGGEQGLANMWGYKFSPEGDYLVVDDCKRDKYCGKIITQGSVFVYYASFKAAVASLVVEQVTAFCWASQAEKVELVTGHTDGSVRVWEEDRVNQRFLLNQVYGSYSFDCREMQVHYLRDELHNTRSSITGSHLESNIALFKRSGAKYSQGTSGDVGGVNDCIPIRQKASHTIVSEHTDAATLRSELNKSQRIIEELSATNAELSATNTELSATIAELCAANAKLSDRFLDSKQ